MKQWQGPKLAETSRKACYRIREEVYPFRVPSIRRLGTQTTYGASRDLSAASFRRRSRNAKYRYSATYLAARFPRLDVYATSRSRPILERNIAFPALISVHSDDEEVTQKQIFLLLRES